MPSSTAFPRSHTCDSQLSPKLKVTMEGKCFELIQEIEAAMTELKILTKKDFHNCFRKYQKTRDNCVQSTGEYSEGANDNPDLT